MNDKALAIRIARTPKEVQFRNIDFILRIEGLKYHLQSRSMNTSNTLLTHFNETAITSSGKQSYIHVLKWLISFSKVFAC